MISFIVLLVTYSSFAVEPIQWSDLGIDKEYQLNQKIKLNPKIRLNLGTKLKLQNIMPLEMINVVSFEVRVLGCSSRQKELTTEMILVNELYGVQLEKNCSLHFYVESKDLYRDSLFIQQ